MEKHEMNKLIKICKLVGHGIVKWKDGTWSVFPNNKLSVREMLYYPKFNDYYLEYGLTFFPDKSKSDVKSICAETMEGTEIRFKERS